MGHRTFLFLSYLIFVFWGHAPGQMALAAASTQPYAIPDDNRWDRGGGYFTKYKQITNTNRWYADPFTTLDPGTIKNIPSRGLLKRDIELVVRDTYFLNSACPIEDTACYEEGDPVLFIHGYMVGTEEIKGGGERTWGEFPRLLQEEGYVLFEYRWNTGTRFQEAAEELEKAIDLIKAKTGKRIHIVAHSFGGVLFRTMLQGIHVPVAKKAVHGIKMQLRIASVVTLGSPYSGIADKDHCRGYLALPRGQDNLLFVGCGQLSCQQIGEDMVDADAATFYGVDDTPGDLLPKLYDLKNNPFPAVDMLTLIGLTTRHGPDDIVDIGDGLITYEGQRFGAYDSFEPTSCDEANGDPKRRKSPYPLRNKGAVNTHSTPLSWYTSAV